MIQIKNKNELCKKLGYNDLYPCLEKIKYLENYGIEEYLNKNFKYDYVLGGEIFLKKLIELCGEKEDMEKF